MNRSAAREETFKLLYSLEIQKENLKEHENKDVLKNLIKKLRFEYKVSYRIMENQLKIGRETLRKMI